MQVIDTSDPAAMAALAGSGKVEVISASGKPVSGSASADVAKDKAGSLSASLEAAPRPSGTRPSDEPGADDEDGDADTGEATGRVVHPAEVVSLEEAASSGRLDYVGTMGTKITVIAGLEAVPDLDHLCLRSNLIETMQNLGHLTKLKHLELYENRVRSHDCSLPRGPLECFPFPKKEARIKSPCKDPGEKTVRIALGLARKVLDPVNQRAGRGQPNRRIGQQLVACEHSTLIPLPWPRPGAALPLLWRPLAES